MNLIYITVHVAGLSLPVSYALIPTVNLGNMLAIVIRVHLMCYTCVPSHIALLHIYYTPS